MATRYYKKPSPKQPVYVNGAPIRFEAVNIETGLYKTDDEKIQTEISALQKRGVGGVFDITEEQYEEIKKKQTSSPGSYRDELGKGISHHQRIAPPNDLVSHAAEESKPVAPVPVAPAVTPLASKRPLPKPRTKS